MIQRNLGHELAAAAFWAQCREIRRIVMVHNIMILIFFGEVFDRARMSGSVSTLVIYDVD